MDFVELTEKEYQKFWENHPQKTFLSAPKIAKLREKTNWKSYFVGVKENKKVVAAALLLSHKRKFNVNEFYSPRGFLLDYNNKELLAFFVEKVKEFAKSKNGYILRIDPYVIYKQRDINGDIVEGGEDNSHVVEHLTSLGFKKVKNENMEQVGWMFSLGLEGKSEEQILKEMQSSTRNTIRKAEKLGITMTELSYDELDRFQNIMEKTGARKNFAVRNLEYYQNMYNLFHDSNEVKYYVTELNLKEYIEKLKETKQEKEEKLSKLKDDKDNEGQRNNIISEIESLDKRIDEAKEIMKTTGKDIITLSGSMFILIDPEVIYLAGGNYEEYMRFNSQYIIQWELIKYGIEHNFKKHNFYGIPANINEHPKDYGIYEFKRRFNGYVEELIGEFELPLKKEYYLIKLLKKLKGGK